jgi:hypothetical protein
MFEILLQTHMHTQKRNLFHPASLTPRQLYVVANTGKLVKDVSGTCKVVEVEEMAMVSRLGDMQKEGPARGNVEAMLGVVTQPANNPGIPGSEGLLHSGTSGKVTQPTDMLVFEALRRVMNV